MRLCGQVLVAVTLLATTGRASAGVWENFDEDPGNQPYPGFGTIGFAGAIQWSTPGGSTNSINFEQDHNDHYFVAHYPGMGWWSLSGVTSHPESTVTSIDFWDDGWAGSHP